MELNNERKRVIIYTWFISGAKAVQCHRNICNYLGQGTVSLRTVEEWYRKFRSGDFAIEDAERTDRPTVVDDGNLRKVIDEDHNITTRELAAQFDVSQTAIVHAIKRLNLTYKFNRWVPHELTEQNKRDRLQACRDLLESHRKKQICHRMITCDEKWIYYNNTSRKGGYSAPGEPVGSTPRRALTNKKVLLCIWWDRHGIIYKEYLQYGQTINQHNYSDMLSKVSVALKEKRAKHYRRKKILFHQDNARPHKSAITMQRISELGWDLMTHPPYSPDMAPSDYYLFSHLQLHLQGAIFKDGEEAISEVDSFLESRSPEFFAEGIDKLPKRWQKIIDLGGDYYPH